VGAEIICDRVQALNGKAKVDKLALAMIDRAQRRSWQGQRHSSTAGRWPAFEYPFDFDFDQPTG
jgi:hypothetical protein